MGEPHAGRPRPAARLTGLPAVLTEGCCPDCGAATVDYAADQPALFRHGGYGETRRTVRRRCASCGWALIAAVLSVRPDCEPAPVAFRPRRCDCRPLAWALGGRCWLCARRAVYFDGVEPAGHLVPTCSEHHVGRLPDRPDTYIALGVPSGR